MMTNFRDSSIDKHRKIKISLLGGGDRDAPTSSLATHW